MTIEPQHRHSHHHSSSSHHGEGVHYAYHTAAPMPTSDSSKIISGYAGAKDKWVGETYYNKYLRGGSSTETQKPAHPYLDAGVHYAPEIFAGSGIAIAAVTGIIMIRKLVSKIKEVLGRRSKIVIKAPVKAKGEGKDFRVRHSYPNAIIPVYGVKEKGSRQENPDTPRGLKEYEDKKKVLRVSRQERCQCCGLMFPHNEFHHLNDNHKDHRAENLALLCRYCHMQFHVDVASSEGGLSAYLPDFSVAELSHLQQYADHIQWEKEHGVRNDAEHWHYYDDIKNALDKRCSFTAGIIQYKQKPRGIIEKDQQRTRGEEISTTKPEERAIIRLHALRKGLKVVYPADSAKNNGNRYNGMEYLYKDAAYKFMNGDYSSFPAGKLDELVSRLKKAPPISEKIKKYVDAMRDNPYDAA